MASGNRVKYCDKPGPGAVEVVDRLVQAGWSGFARSGLLLSRVGASMGARGRLVFFNHLVNCLGTDYEFRTRPGSIYWVR